jgi:hypothetical protein
MSDGHTLKEAESLTAMSLRKFIEASDQQLTYLTVPEKNMLVEEISRIIPAGNVPSLISAGLAKLPGRAVSASDNRRNLSLLMQGVQTFLDRAVYQTFFAGPAALLSAYQMMLKLSGKDPAESFPEGTWQFYVEFGLREDKSRHASETTGFQTAAEALRQSGRNIGDADMLAAWLMAAGWLLGHYQELLSLEWSERTILRLATEATGDKKLADRWLHLRPYTGNDYLAYRRAAFEAFCATNINLSQEQRQTLDATFLASLEGLTAYQQQMNICAYLEPSEYSDSRIPMPPELLRIGLIINGRYYLADLATATHPESARALAAQLLESHSQHPPAALDTALLSVPRRYQANLRKAMPSSSLRELDRLHTAPIIINWEQATAPTLSGLRAGRRGIGDHPLTIFRTDQSHVFDYSHIFLDGFGGMALAEILTGQAVAHLGQLAQSRAGRNNSQPNSALRNRPAPEWISLALPGEITEKLGKYAETIEEVSAENTGIRLSLLEEARQDLERRTGSLRLTINDLLILYRVVFGYYYQPEPSLCAALDGLKENVNPAWAKAVGAAYESIEVMQTTNPSLLIPIDASNIEPRQRVYPTTFRNPFTNIITLHEKALESFRAIEQRDTTRSPETIRETRREYLALLHAFGELMRRTKDISMQGESVSTATIRLLAGLPPSVQRMLDSLPRRFDVVNDVVKGQEVFSNVGRAAPQSSLRRFNTAKDDNEKKTLAWGILTDVGGTVHVSLRDFRPHVGMLAALGRRDLAEAMSKDLLDAYADGINRFMDEMIYILRARGERRQK